jgi:hypothetical protein
MEMIRSSRFKFVFFMLSSLVIKLQINLHQFGVRIYS